MAPSDIQEQLRKHLTDAHSIEQQALIQMKMAPALAGDERLAELFSRHRAETEDHEHRVRDRLATLGAKPALVKDLAGQLTGVGFALFAKLNPDTPGKLVAHGYSYEHMEAAAYALLAGVADRAGDTETAAMAREIEAQENAMAQRLAASFDIAVEASLRDSGPEDISKQLDAYLEDAHAIEGQSIQLLKRGQSLAGAPEFAQALEEHLAQTREHERLIEARLRERGASPSRIKDTALRLGALNWGAFFAAQPDTPLKLAGFAFAVEHLEVAAYELLRRVAVRAGDTETDALAQRILAEERQAADRVHGLFDRALEAGLRDQGVSAR